MNIIQGGYEELGQISIYHKVQIVLTLAAHVQNANKAKPIDNWTDVAKNLLYLRCNLMAA